MREQQTLGRRIQEARKAAGLSQESLGERLGVSRQAVSKWEADAAVPELENLIAMSRIFGVTIGALLGVEPEAAEDRSEKDAPEAPGEGVEGTAPAGELTDRELAAVEAIAKKYLDAAQVVQNPRLSRRRKFLAGAAVCAVLVLAAPLEQLIIAQLLERERQAQLLRHRQEHVLGHHVPDLETAGIAVHRLLHARLQGRVGIINLKELIHIRFRFVCHVGHS